MNRRYGMRVTPSSSAGYRPGDNFMSCDVCGFRMRASEARKQPHGPHEGLWVCPKDYDEYNPQWDGPIVPSERITPDKVNPEPTSTTITPSTLRFDFTFTGTFGSDESDKITTDDLL